MDFKKIFSVLIDLLEKQAEEKEGVEQEVTYTLVKKEDVKDAAAL